MKFRSKSKIVVFTLALLGFLGLGSFYLFHKQSYLIPPTGRYGVGYEDHELIHPELCPDQFYKKGQNERDFSVKNPQYCHEIAIRIFYPTQSGPRLGDLYYAPAIKRNNRFYARYLQLSPQGVDSLNELLTVRTYSKKGEPVSQSEKFPVIVFLPGAGMPVQSYSSLVAELVSQGFVVIGVNSFFANGALEAADGRVVEPPDDYQDAARTQSFQDLKYVLYQMKSLPISGYLRDQIDFERVGLAGHSMGAMSIVNLMKERSPFPIRAILLLDPGNILESKNYPIRLEKTPMLLLWSSKFRSKLKGSAILDAQSFEITLSPNGEDLDFSNHQNFSDLSTLQYHPAIRNSLVYPFLRDPNGLGVGQADGHELTRISHAYALEFFKRFLKGDRGSFPLRDINQNRVMCLEGSFQK